MKTIDQIVREFQEDTGIGDDEMLIILIRFLKQLSWPGVPSSLFGFLEEIVPADQENFAEYDDSQWDGEGDNGEGDNIDEDSAHLANLLP